MSPDQSGDSVATSPEPVATTPEHVRKRGCGCSWIQIYSVLVRFLSRCPEHTEMCRNLEDWEIELCRGDD